MCVLWCLCDLFCNKLPVLIVSVCSLYVILWEDLYCQARLERFNSFTASQSDGPRSSAGCTRSESSAGKKRTGTSRTQNRRGSSQHTHPVFCWAWAYPLFLSNRFWEKLSYYIICILSRLSITDYKTALQDFWLSFSYDRLVSIRTPSFSPSIRFPVFHDRVDLLSSSTWPESAHRYPALKLGSDLNRKKILLLLNQSEPKMSEEKPFDSGIQKSIFTCSCKCSWFHIFSKFYGWLLWILVIGDNINSRAFCDLSWDTIRIKGPNTHAHKHLWMRILNNVDLQQRILGFLQGSKPVLKYLE